MSALVLANATARAGLAPDSGRVRPEVIEAIIETVDQAWGNGITFAAVNPENVAGDDEATAQRWGRFLRLAASPRSPPR